MTALENVEATPVSPHQCARVRAPRWPLVGSSESDAVLMSGHKMATEQVLASAPLQKGRNALVRPLKVKKNSLK